MQLPKTQWTLVQSIPCTSKIFCCYYQTVNHTVKEIPTFLYEVSMGRWDGEGEDWPPALICRG